MNSKNSEESLNKYLDFLTYNVEGLKVKLKDPSFLKFIEGFDIITLVETWLDGKQKLNLEGFWDYSQIRPKHEKAIRHSGGITVLVKDNLRPGIKMIKNEEGFIWLKMSKTFFRLQNDVFICATYIPPERTTVRINKKTDYWENFIKSLIEFSSLGNILITGDLNARTGITYEEQIINSNHLNQMFPNHQNINYTSGRNNCDSKTNKYGKKLLEICTAFNLNIANGIIAGNRLGNFTCFNSGGASVVDYFIGDNDIISSIHEMIVLPPTFNSKHTPITAKIEVEILTQKIYTNMETAPKTFRWEVETGEIFKKILFSTESLKVIERIQDNLRQQSNGNKSIDTAVNRLTDHLKTIASKSLKIIKRTVQKQNINKHKKSLQWYDKECIKLKKRLNNLAYIFSKNHKNPYIASQYNKCIKEYNKLIKQKKRRAEIAELNALKLIDNPQQFWKKIRNLRGNTNDKKTINLITPTQWYEYFSKLTNPTDPNIETEYIDKHNEVEEELKQILQNANQSDLTDIINKPFTQKEVEEGIHKLENNKASGNDSISNEMLKAGIKILSPLINNLFNSIQIYEYYPDLWGIGMISPLLKSNDPIDPDNYRGITINSCFSKLFTKLMNDRLTKYIEDNELINRNQIGFRKGHRTSDHVFVLKTLIDKYFNSGKKLYVCFIDFKKAYDTIWREGLYYKLLKMGINQKFIKLLINLYSGIKSCVNLGKGITKEFNSKVGLKQGCNLSPNLFNLYINDIIKCFDTNESKPANLLTENINCLLYADDMVIIYIRNFRRITKLNSLNE